ncbi:ATP-binding protein [Spirosoma rhododendri]|uniref:Transcriptional regulator n=1 Tax=Spirosoma rhododendri TaxID=2728024 RepID=A0A7L5DM03_9BACT|nr:ATP-binding protein [Spirosoma rhododendri]QJD78521.1 transcriptional regulator [Spirosoma rhododendri]
MQEGQEIDKKALTFLRDNKNTDWNELAKDCVSFANANGGKILIGIDDDASEPVSSQTIDEKWLDTIRKQVSQRTYNVSVTPQLMTAANGGQYIEVLINRNAQSVAGTTDGRYYIRVSDESKPVLPDELLRLAADKNALIWEEQTNRKVPKTRADNAQYRQFLADVRASQRVSRFIKEKSDDEILEHYLFVKGDYLTNLGILWIGQRQDRATLLYAPVIQFIKRDDREEKVNKIVWDDYYLNPKELLQAVQTEIPDWQEAVEIPDGLFRTSVPNYDIRVVRELVANALVHKSYTVRGDIFINLFTDRLEIHSPGLLPLGVTPQNIISQSVRRNNQLAQVFYDLGLMEKEGSGYDLIYETLLAEGKSVPMVEEGNDRVVVTVYRRIIRSEIVRLVRKANEEYSLRQKEVISLGLIAQYSSLSALELTKRLDIKEAQGVRNWLGRLPELGLVESKGKTKATEYHINPAYLRRLNYKGKTDLTKIAPHRLRELILTDLEIYQPAPIRDIHERIGKEISERKVKRQIDALIDEGTVVKIGVNNHTRYSLSQNLSNNQQMVERDQING